MKKADKDFRFYVGSLIDKDPSDYIAICNQYGVVVGHRYGKDLFTAEPEADKPIEEVKILNQLNLF